MDPAIDTSLLTTPFVASWFARARPGDLFDPDMGRRAAAWAHWALTSMRSMTGHGERSYIGLALPGKFYDPHRSTTTGTVPHLEIPAATFDRPDPLFPERLAHAGNALSFPWWVLPEVLAVKRAVLTPRGGDVAALARLLAASRPALIEALTPVSRTAAQRWSEVEALRVADPAALSASATAGFSAREVAEYMPAAAALNLSVVFDRTLAERSGDRTARRVGVWWVRGAAGEPFTLGVLTPRLTRSSLFTDPLFAAEREAPAALLVRGLLLRRILRDHLGAPVQSQVAAARPSAAQPRLRTVVARVGEKVPEASAAAAAHFVGQYPDTDQAWSALVDWAAAPAGPAGGPRAQLSVTQASFAGAHRAATRAIGRAEDPARDDVNVLLPLAWDHKGRVVRVTFARPAGDGGAD